MTDEWISAREAAEAIWPGKKPAPVPNSITKRAEVGLVKGRARLLTCGGVEQHNCPVPRGFWGGRAMIADWASGDFTGWVAQNGLENEWRVYGATFDRSDIEAMAPPSAAPDVLVTGSSADVASPVSAPKNLGGRPSKDWEAVMIELAGQLWEGALQPVTQADIENAIKDHLSAKGADVSDTAAREHARPLYRRLTRKDRN